MKTFITLLATSMLALSSMSASAVTVFDVDKCVAEGNSWASCWHESQKPGELDTGGDSGEGSGGSGDGGDGAE